MLHGMSDTLKDVESSLFGRMLTNAFKGFGVGAALGVAAGALLGALAFGSGLLPATLLPAAIQSFSGGIAAVAGALTGALTLAAPCGGFGAVAGIQSTRDARRYLLAHEAPKPALIPESLDAPRQALAKSKDVMVENVTITSNAALELQR